MDAHFRAFSFVDRITGVEPGVRIRGQFAIPAGLDAFPTSLVAEAVGQLAAWSAMAAVGFTHRPVAGIAGRIELISEVRPGQVLDLAADLESVDTESAGYSGTASVEGRTVIRLSGCVGPMVPVADFDDPQALQDRFALLCKQGATPGAFGGVPALELERANGEPSQSAHAILQVPAQAPFFADHFPRRPVFPGTLLMHANLQTAALLAREVPAGAGAAWVPRVVSDVKLRTFIPPGETLSVNAKRTELTETSLATVVEARINQRLVGSAKILFAREVIS
jgi:3-hydroxymyristoyl/3-hydroxydecanoyl-(acyl carrier protein) dehydratase